MTSGVALTLFIALLAAVLERCPAAEAADVAATFSCYSCVQWNYNREDQTCWENSFNRDAVPLLTGCKCCRKAVSASGVQRACILPRFDPDDVYCKSAANNYICTSDGCNAATPASLRMRGSLVLVVSAILAAISSVRPLRAMIA